MAPRMPLGIINSNRTKKTELNLYSRDFIYLVANNLNIGRN